ncbi:MAG TPA: hypothetical protein VM869_28570 [Enhygromyxa sp.]|nr:hypothetical protein [Enhygromyxa sp.]
MRWALFQQVMQKLASVRELDPRRDAARYAEQLLGYRPRLFAQIEGGAESVTARMAALTIAGDHLREVCRLPTYVDELERSLAIATMTPGERLVRVAALAYLVCARDLIRDDLPAGYGLIDDCISIRGAVLATPGPRPRKPLASSLLGELLIIRYLSLAVPEDVLPMTGEALTHAATLAARTRGLPNSTIEAAIRHLVEHPPEEFPATLPLPEPSEPIAVESMLPLTPGELLEARGEHLLFGFPDGSQLRREAGGALSEG